MNYLDLEQPWLEWEADLIAEEQYHCYLEGQNDALNMKKPQDPDNSCYMMGWSETMKKISTGQIKPSVNNHQNHHLEEF